MATKYYCDVCEKEKQLHELAQLTLTSLDETHGDYVADVCKDCKGKVLATLKQFRTSMIISLEIPETNKKGKKQTTKLNKKEK